MSFNFAIDPECPEGRRKAFFNALHESSVRRLADEAVQTAATLFDKHGRLTEIRAAVLLAEASGMSVADAIPARIDDFQSQRAGMKRYVADFNHFIAEQRERFSVELSRCTAVLIDGPAKIETLRTKVRNYEQSREAMTARLREAGLDDDAIRRAGIKPDAADLSAWLSEVEAVERDVRVSKAFIASGPVYDASLLSEMRNG
jgi:hypothetical protein